MKQPIFIYKMDWQLLREQKALLLETINNNAVSPKHKEALEGILHTLDAMQDYAVDGLLLPEPVVFGIDTEIKDSHNNPIREGDAVKIFHTCKNCNSDNVQIKHWVNPNTNEIGDGMEDDDDVWCEDCETHSGINISELKADAKVIGFQVVGEGENEGQIHHQMDASFCIYSLSQANEMLAMQNYGWRLQTIWEGDVEEPTICFEGNPRT